MDEIFTKTPRELNPIEQQSINEIRQAAQTLLLKMRYGSDEVERYSDELTLAVRKLEESVDWAIKHYTK